MMNTRKTPASAPASRAARNILRDPAMWAWVVVALLAIIPARAAFTHDRGDAAATASHRQAVKSPS